MRYLSRKQYEAVLRSALRGLGLDEASIEALIDARWPMDVSGAVAELSARGLEVDPEIVRRWVDQVGKDAPGYAGPDSALLTPQGVDALAGWLVEFGLCRSTHVGKLMGQDFAPIKRIIEQGQPVDH